MLTFATLCGTRRIGRPPIRWLESIKEDLGKEWLWIEINGGSSLGRSRLELGCRTRRRRYWTDKPFNKVHLLQYCLFILKYVLQYYLK
jgi:hypothetical protein